MRAATKTPTSHSTPFSVVADTYDDVFSDSPIGRAQRHLVWKEVDRVFRPGQRILEINCGTGIDALHLAQRGVEVCACDAAPEMITIAQERLRASSHSTHVEFRCLPSEGVGELVSDGPYDGVLSNFAGLDCVGDLQALVRNLARLVRPGGQALVCIFGAFCLWEVLWYASKADFRKAFRRLNRRGVEGVLAPSQTVTVHYRSVGTLRSAFAPWFRLEHRRGVGIASPPSYAGSLPLRFPRVFRLAVEIDGYIGSCPGVRSLADHAVLVLRRTGECVI